MKDSRDTALALPGTSMLYRRAFVGRSAAAVGGLLSPAAVIRAIAAELGDTVAARSLRPEPDVTIMAAILRRKPPYWLGWPGSSYDLEGHQTEYLGALAETCERLRIECLTTAAPVEAKPELGGFVDRIREARPDAVVLVLQHMACWRDVSAVVDAGRPTIIFAPVGTAFTGHVREISRRPGVFVVSSLDFGGVEFGLRMIRAKRRFEETRVLWIRGDTRNETVMERLGLAVRRLPRRVFNELFDRIPVTPEARAVASDMAGRARKVVEPSEEDLLNAARTYVTAKQLLRDEQANALTMDCLGMVGGRLVPTPPCMAWSMLQDAGVTAGCEADLFGAVSLMCTSYLFDKPGFMNDPVPETVHNRLIAAHCTCGTCLRGLGTPSEPFILRSHSESDKGVSMQVLWHPGQRVTLVRFKDPNSVILDSGTVVRNVDTPPAGGCRTSFEIAMDDVRDVRDVKGFHQVVLYGDHRREVAAFCQMYGITVESSG